MESDQGSEVSEDENPAKENGDENSKEEEKENEESEKKTFADLGLVEVLVQACEKMGWKHPSKIQSESIPIALEGKDIIGLAETGSGKTGAFALPILQSLLENPQR